MICCLKWNFFLIKRIKKFIMCTLISYSLLCAFWFCWFTFYMVAFLKIELFKSSQVNITGESAIKSPRSFGCVWYSTFHRPGRLACSIVSSVTKNSFFTFCHFSNCCWKSLYISQKSLLILFYLIRWCSISSSLTLKISSRLSVQAAR